MVRNRIVAELLGCLGAVGMAALGGEGVGKPMLPKFDELQGRFAGILPPIKPMDNEAQMARFVLAGMGYGVEGKGADPIWN